MPTPHGTRRSAGRAAAALLLLPGALAAQASPRAIAATDLGGGLTLLASPPDGNILVVRGRASALVVDALSPEHAERADSAIRAAAGGAPRRVVNTHYHFDHIGANPRLAGAGASTIAHPAVRTLAARDTTIPELNWDLDPAEPAALPRATVADSARYDLGGEVAHVVHMPAAHTGGDLVVRLERANVIHAGDIVEFGAYPFVDWWAGGSFDGLVAAVDRILAMAGEDTRIVPGHGRLLSRADLVAYRDMLRSVGGRVRQAIAAGESVETLVNRNITASWDGEHGGARQGQRFVRLLHHELRQEKRRP